MINIFSQHAALQNARIVDERFHIDRIERDDEFLRENLFEIHTTDFPIICE